MYPRLIQHPHEGMMGSLRMIPISREMLFRTIPSHIIRITKRPCLILTSDPKPRLRWTADLHERLIDVVTQLGGPNKATQKAIMRTMNVKGLTLLHLKSHLQKYRLGKQSGKDMVEASKDGISASYLTESPHSGNPFTNLPTPDIIRDLKSRKQ